MIFHKCQKIELLFRRQQANVSNMSGHITNDYTYLAASKPVWQHCTQVVEKEEKTQMAAETPVNDGPPQSLILGSKFHH